LAFFLEDEAPGLGLIFLKGQRSDIIVVQGKGRHERLEVGKMEVAEALFFGVVCGDASRAQILVAFASRWTRQSKCAGPLG
jgi:hypothetical protein